MSANTNDAVIEKFYRAFQQRDGATMASCYHPQARFRDPVFDLQGERIGKMWIMLCTRGEDLRVEFANVTTDSDRGAADWQAWYTFKTTGKSVHNVIHANFKFADGLILEHTDEFDFWRWSRQAIGPAGWLLGWTPMLRNKIRSEANKTLDRFVAS